MAKRIRSLEPSRRSAAKAAPNNASKEPKKNSPKGLKAKLEANRRAVRDVNTAPTKRRVLRAAKEAAGPVVVREKKTVQSDNSLFAGMTPRQIKRAKRSPERLDALRKDRSEQELAKVSAKEELRKLRANKLSHRKAKAEQK
jgi:hypothetical protein